MAPLHVRMRLKGLAANHGEKPELYMETKVGGGANHQAANDFD